MKWLKRIAIAVGVIVLLLAAAPFFISLNDYIPRIEKEISAKLKEPVKIGGLRAAGLPLPHVTVDGITVGKTEDIKVGKVTVTPDLLSLFGATKVIKSIEIDKLVLTQKAIDKIPVWTKSEPVKPGETPAPPQVRVQSIKLDDALVKLDKVSFGPFDARVTLADTGDPVEASLVTRDGKMKVLIKPSGANYQIDANAKGWKLPAGPAIHFDELNIKGVATLKDANLNDVRAKLYGGTVAGKAALGWEKGLQVKGNLDVNQVELKTLAPLLSPGTNVSGKLNAKPVFSANAASAAQIMSALRLETPFNVQNGVLYGVDITKAATSIISKDGGTGGETRFEELSGRLASDRGTHRFTALKIVSGSLSADGNVTISPKQELSGKLNANVKASKLGSASVPLNVSGTTQSPMLLPTAGYLAGAVAGTAILGPGIGTSVGSKVGRFAEGLFGKKEEKKK